MREIYVKAPLRVSLVMFVGSGTGFVDREDTKVVWRKTPNNKWTMEWGNPQSPPA